MSKSKAAGLQGFVTAAQRLPKEALACPQPTAHPSLLPLVLWEPSGPLVPPAFFQDKWGRFPWSQPRCCPGTLPCSQPMGEGITKPGLTARPHASALTRNESSRGLFAFSVKKYLLSTYWELAQARPQAQGGEWEHWGLVAKMWALLCVS